MKQCGVILTILAALSASLAFAEDFKTIKGKEYKNATVIRVEPDGIVIRYKSGISKIFFVELPGEVADKWLAPVIAAKKAAEEKRIEAQKAAQHEREEKERELQETERDREEKEKNADADLRRAEEEFQAAEQRASEAYRTAAKGTLLGQVFVSSRAGENFKLGAVEVGLFARDAVDSLLVAARKHADTKIHGASLDFYYSGSFYLGLLLNPIRVAETDADGRFAIEVPTTGNFVIAAKAQRSVGEQTEHYYWLQPVSLEGEQQLTQNLSNNNLTSTTGTSLIHTDD